MRGSKAVKGLAGAQPQPERRCESWKERSRSALEAITHENAGATGASRQQPVGDARISQTADRLADEPDTFARERTGSWL
jgi:hypothetical protein